MAIKKGRATDAVARLFSVTAAEQAHEAHEGKREHPVPETHEAYEAYEVWRGIFLTPSAAGNSFHRCVNSFHRCGGPHPSMREVLGAAPVKACGLAVDCI